MMTIDENTLGIWYIQVSDTQDFMGVLSRNLDGSGSTFTYRFRYYKDDKAFDSDDEKHWYTVKIPAKELFPTSLIQKIVDEFSAMAGVPRFEMLRGNRTLKEFIEIFSALPFVHSKLERVQ